MNNYYTLIYLIREWKETLNQARFVEAICTRKNLVELYFDNDQSHRLVFSSASQHTALFLDRYQRPRRENTASFFSDLAQNTLTDIQLADSDRFVTFLFNSGKSLIFLLYSNQANVFLCENSVVVEAFKKNKVLQGNPIATPRPVQISHTNEFIKIQDVIGTVDPLLPRTIVRSLLKGVDVRLEPDLAIRKVLTLQDSLKSGAIPHYSTTYGFSIVEPKLMGDSDVQYFETVNEAVAYSFFKWVKYLDFDLRKRTVLDRINKNIKKAHLAISQLHAGSQDDSKATTYEQLGHILMSNPHSVMYSDSIVLPNYYDDGNEIEIKVDPAISSIENAEVYYQKARSIRRSMDTYAKRLSDFKLKLDTLLELADQVGAIQYGKDLEKWIKSNENVLRKMGFADNDSVQTSQHFRTYWYQGNEIRVGKSATSNDELLRITHKDDIWLHARGVSGSHVVIPMNRSQQKPGNDLLEYAAGLAAFFSKAKGSSLVPVIFTRKKFVRKSKGMAPGSVFVDKEEVTIVPPVRPESVETDD
jgi:predicted ribosome quality control (RQC) complex YloA/Tae2 family protein